MATRIESKQINFRVTEEEFNRLSQMANDNGLSVSAFCKMKAKGTKTKTPKVNHDGVIQITSELRRVGSNVNQIAKYLNSGYNVTEEQINAIREDLNSIWHLLN